ncbi:S-layer homology domain-containing protein [Thermoanaerobacterium saccharolyticum]
MKRILSWLLVLTLVLTSTINVSTAFAADGNQITSSNSNILLKYDFNQTSGNIARDSSGNGFDGTLNGNASWAGGKNFGGLVLDGTNNTYVTIPNDVLKNLQSDITISLNINLNAAGHYWAYALGSGGSTSKLIGIELNGTSIKGYYINGSQNTVSTNTTGLVGKWTNITFVVSTTNGSEKLYVNGVLTGTKTGVTAPISALYDSSKSFGGYIGESYWTSDPNVNGYIDDFRVYNCALSDEQIQEIANMTVTGGVTDVNVATSPGVAPTMPKYVYVPCADGTTQELEVTWNPIDPSKYSETGSFDVNGTTTYGNLQAVAHVYVMPVPTLNVSSKTENSITLNWTEEPGVVVYNVYRSTTSGSGYTQIYSGNNTSYTDTGLEMNTTYYYYLNYTTSEVTSCNSPELAVKTKVTLVGPPTNFTQSKYLYPYRVELSWDTVQYADSYNIYRSDSEDGEYKLIANTQDTSYKDRSVTQGSTYYYKVSCVNDAGEGPLSSALKAQTATDSVPPTVLTLDGTTDSTASLSWQPVTGATNYTLYRTTISGKAYSRVYSGTDTSYTDTNLITGSTYYYVVTYTNSLGTSVYSNEVKAITAAAKVPAPSMVQVTGSYANAISIRWNNVVGATSYNVYRASSADGTYTKIANVTDINYKDDGLQPSTTYYYRISSVNAAGEGNLSKLLTATTASMDDQIYNNEAVKYDVDGNPLPSGGEGFLQVGDTYYMYSGVSNESGYSNSIGCYSSKDLIHWKFESVVFSSNTVDANGNHPYELTRPDGFKDERPKVVYDDKLKKYIMVFHYENGVDYSLGEITVSMSDTPTGPFTYVATYHPDGMESRDMTLFKDVDGQVYLISAANKPGEGANAKLSLFKFAPDYKSATLLYNIYGGPNGNGYYAGREAPAMVKKDGIYYLLTSSCAGWYPSQAMYSTAKADTLADTVALVLSSDEYQKHASAVAVWKGDTNIDYDGGWDGGGVAFYVGNKDAFSSQSTYILPVTGTHGTSYILMSDRLKCPASMGGTVWFPLQLDDGKLSFDYSPTISINVKTGEVKNIYPGALISEGKPATASIVGTSSDGITHVATYANDGDYQTSWWSPNSDYPAWWQVDLGQEYNIGQVQLSWYLIGGSEGVVYYKIWVSDDGINYTLAVDHSSNQPFYGFTCDTLSNVTGRYVKVELTGCSVWWYNPEIYEAKIYGSPVSGSATVTTPDSNGSYSYQIPDYIVNLSATGNYALNLGNVSINMPISNLLNNLDHGVLTVSNDKTSSNTLLAINSVMTANSKVVGAFDLNLSAADGANIHEFDTAANVTLHLTSDMIASLSGNGTPKLFYYDPAKKELVDMNAVFDLTNGTATFSTTHFSTYVIAITDLTQGGGSGSGGGSGTNSSSGNGSVSGSGNNESNYESEYGTVTKTGGTLLLKVDKDKINSNISDGSKAEVAFDLTKIGDASKKSVEIPLAVLNALKENSKDIVINSYGISIKLINGVLDLNNITDSVTLTIEDKGKTNVANYTPLSNTLDISIKSENGNIAINKPVEVTLNISKVNDPRKAAVYYYNNTTGEWEYVGGKVNKADNTITFSATHFSQYAAFEYDKTFNDIKNHWAKDDIEVLASKHIVEGVDANNFAPDKTITRAEFAAMMIRLLGIPEETYKGEFSDVKAGDWYANAIEAAYKAGIVLGDGSNMRPNDKITREEMAAIAMRVYGKLAAYNEEQINKTTFSDDNIISDWAKNAVANAVKQGIINGEPNNMFAPKGNATRAEAAAVLYNLLDKSNNI